MKKRWIFSAIFIFVVAVLVLYFFYLPQLKPETRVSSNTDFFSVQRIIERIEDPKLCYVSDELEYLYYEDTPVLWEPNNKFGLYIYAENRQFFELAQQLVNSNGGDWGYVLIPYNMDDRDLDKWNRVFGQLNSKKLIPIIQLWRLDKENYKEQTEEVAIFLNRFIWPIKYRYISVYNEPNDDNFWFGELDPEEYAEILDYTISTFKKYNPDYFMLNGAFNISAPNSLTTMDAFNYMRKMDSHIPGIFSRLDGWASHPYPQPNFSSSPNNYGRWSISAYEDELEFLKDELGVNKDLPVFITETGWAHAEGVSYNSSFLSSDTVADYFVEAYTEVWLKDSRVRAVTPFTIRYNPPYDHFSWVNNDYVPYLQYEKVKELSKETGKPPTLVPASISFGDCE